MGVVSSNLIVSSLPNTFRKKVRRCEINRTLTYVQYASSAVFSCSFFFIKNCCGKHWQASSGIAHCGRQSRKGGSPSMPCRLQPAFFGAQNGIVLAAWFCCRKIRAVSALARARLFWLRQKLPSRAALKRTLGVEPSLLVPLLRTQKKASFHWSFFGAQNGTRTHTAFAIRPSNVRVYQFHHLSI